MLTKQFDEALAFASDLHRDQRRKGTPVPYISHLMAVASLVLESHGDETINRGIDMEAAAIGALLHDALEDQADKVTEGQIAAVFGPTAARIVVECTDALGEPKPGWHERKQRYIESIPTKCPGAQLVTCADKLHNARCIVRDARVLGDELWDRFTGSGEKTRDDVAWYYESLVEAIREAWPAHPLVGALAEEVEQLAGLAHR